MARSIDKVDTDILPDAGSSSRVNSDTALLFLLIEVHRGRTIVNFADLVGLTSEEEDTLTGRRLTGIDVSHDTDVSDSFKRDGFVNGYHRLIVIHCHKLFSF